MTRTCEMGDGVLVTLIMATHDGPAEVDVEEGRPVDPADPRRPGDVILHDADTDPEAFARALEAVAHVLRDAS